VPIKEIADQNFEEIPTQEEKPIGEVEYWQLGRIRVKKPIGLATAILLFLLLLLLLVLLVLSQKPPKPVSLPIPPTPTPTPFEEKIASPSAYATDSAILKIEQDLKTLDQDLQLTDLKETSLNPPALDWEVEFEE
jgi:hypothetical protein